MNATSRRDKLRSYVRSTELVLTLQIFASIVAALATGYMLLQLRPLVAERERLTIEVAKADSQLSDLRTAQAGVAAALESAKDQLARTERELAATSVERDALEKGLSVVSGDLKATIAALKVAEADRKAAERARNAALAAELELRELVLEQRDRARAAQRASRDIVRNAIKSFHGDDFAAAIRSYQRALQVDPRNPYILNLKSYAEFKIGKTDDAIETLRRSLTIDPVYVWGYFDLMRYQCAAGDYAAALKTLDDALANATDGPIDPLFPKNRRSDLLTGKTGLKFFLIDANDGEGDGEFQRLCRPLLPKLNSLLETVEAP